MNVVRRALTLGVLPSLFFLAGCAAWSPAPNFPSPISPWKREGKIAS